jgi:4-amino-4-deoxy-L-arabinose transferase-like glycosyltransferase/CRISPR/Cas system-associated endoribonuclease Cas2
MNRLLSKKKILGVDRCSFILLLLVVFYMINNLIILKNDNTPFLWDGGDYFYKSLKYYDVFANLDSNFISRFNEISPYRPPLFLLTSLPFYLVFGKSTDVAVMTNFVYLIILVFSVYAIGKRLHSKETGLLASFIVSSFPILFGLSRSYWLDFPLTAMVSLSFYLLLRTDYFRNRKFSLLFGISTGLGMLTKWTYFVFLAGPFLYFFIASFKEISERDKRVNKPFLNATIAILIGMAVASFWYIPNGLSVATKLFGLSVGITSEEATRFQQLGESIGPSGIFNIKSLTFYAGQLVNHQISFFYSILFGIFTLFLLWKGKKETNWILLLWIVVSVIAFTLIKNKTMRNTVPMIPAIGLVIAMGVLGIKKVWVRNVLIAFIIAIGLFQYTISSYGTSYLPEKLSIRIPIGDVIFFQQHANTSNALYRANTGDWKADEILNVIDSSRGDKKDIEIVLMPRDAFTWMAMEYSSYLRGMPFSFIGAVESPESVLRADYVLIKKGGFVAPWFLMDNIHHSLNLMEENMEDFTLIKSVVLPEDRAFLPVYDIKATKRGRKSGVIFSGKLQVIEYSVSETSRESNRNFTVETILKSFEKIDGEIIFIFKLLNKKVEVLMKKAVRPNVPISGLKKGEVKTITSSLKVLEPIVENVFSVEIGFYDSVKGKLLTYRPEYLIYKRKSS